MSTPTQLSIDADQITGVLDPGNIPIATSDLPGAVLPDEATISLNMTTGEIATIGFTGTIVTAKLTTGGTNGSMTFNLGLLVSQVAAT
jgi:hypothetical protein